jgi:hypothetical protein
MTKGFFTWALGPGPLGSSAVRLRAMRHCIAPDETTHAEDSLYYLRRYLGMILDNIRRLRNDRDEPRC